MGNNIVYSINDLFDINSENSILEEYEANKYFIPPYQRGYKWSSKGRNSQVYKLMDDLYTAYHHNEKKEYYLQFITIKKLEDNKVLELIDGQQRLTTLTILLAVLQYEINILQNPPSYQFSIANKLLLYGVRDNVQEFFEKYIYDNNIKTIIETANWNEFINKNEEYNEQDIWYIFEAVKCISNFLKNKFKDLKGYNEFNDYILEDVKILLNYIDTDVNTEEIFTNLNINKVELTNSELLKGLFLTYSGTEQTDITAKEIKELRCFMGRHWDDISYWTNIPKIEQFFFSKKILDGDKSIESFLFAFASIYGYETQEKNNEVQKENKRDINVFNYFETKTRNLELKFYCYDCFEKMIIFKQILNDWYNDNDIHNKLGYLNSRKSKPFKFLKFLKDSINFLENNIKTRPEIKEILKKEIVNALPNPENIEYGENDDGIHDILLAISVFDNLKDNTFFDFFQYHKEYEDHEDNWTLEHIFPQTPKALPNMLGIDDLKLIKTLLGNSLNDYDSIKEKLNTLYIDDVENLYNNVKSKIESDKLEYTDNEKKIIYELIGMNKLHSIGNMALLTGKLNSSNSNGMFDSKRMNIVKKVSEGHFVPKHTYNVFSKLLGVNMTPDLRTWTSKDIDVHEQYIKDKINEIKEKL